MFLDESGFRLQPLNRRTWAPIGSRPQQRVSASHDRLSVIGSLSVTPTRGLLRTHFSIQEENVRMPDVLRYLRQLRRRYRGPLIVVMDRLGAHRSAVKELQHEGATWLQVEWLPGYAPDLNPVEALWSYTKYTTLANFIPDDFADLHDAVVAAVGDTHFQPTRLRSCFQSAQLNL